MKVAFLDRDGTLIYEPAHGHVPPEDVRILPGVTDGLRALQDADYALVMVSNQGQRSAPRGKRESDFILTQKILLDTLLKEGITFLDVFMCPHGSDDGCACRKPKTGMVDEFLETHEIDRAQSVMIGDRPTDGEFAKNIGVRFISMESNGAFSAVDSL